MTVFDALIKRAIANENRMIEEACERMLTDPRGWGVRVDRYSDSIQVALSEDVPFGEVHEYRRNERAPAIS